LTKLRSSVAHFVSSVSMAGARPATDRVSPAGDSWTGFAGGPAYGTVASAPNGKRRDTMRSIITSALLGLGALGLTAASPAQAHASWLSEFLHSQVAPGYYGGPYGPGTSAVP
jgi:hypothetical protein